MSVPMLEVEGLRVRYRGSPAPAVDGVDLTVRAGEFVALVGESGSGKSTLSQALLALLAEGAVVEGGSIRWEGEELRGLSERRMRRIRGSQIGLVPQDPRSSLNPVHRIIDQVVDAIRLHRPISRALARPLAAELLGSAGFPDPASRGLAYPHELSGGTLQRALIALALAGDPSLLVADEPTSALDVTVQKAVLDRLGALARDRNIAVLFVTHDLAVVAERADRVVVMREGRIVEQGPADEIVRYPTHAYTRKLIAAARLEIRRSADRPPLTVEPAVEAIGLRKIFRGRGSSDLAAVDGVSFRVDRGRTLGIVGESGAGKTTIARMVMQLEKPDAGELRVLGTDSAKLGRTGLRILRRDLQMVYQNPYSSLNPRQRVGDAIAEPLVNYGVEAGVRQARVSALLEDVALPAAVRYRLPSELSGGQRQRVAIARALALEPSVIVLDEPVSALDASVQAQILDLLLDVQQRHALTYLLISHDLQVVEHLADEVLVLRAGKAVEAGLAQEVLRAPRHEYTRQLLEAVPILPPSEGFR